MKIRHAYSNIYEVTDTDGLIVWFRGTWKECKKYFEKEKKKRDDSNK